MIRVDVSPLSIMSSDSYNPTLLVIPGSVSDSWDVFVSVQFNEIHEKI